MSPGWPAKISLLLEDSPAHEEMPHCGASSKDNSDGKESWGYDSSLASGLGGGGAVLLVPLLRCRWPGEAGVRELDGSSVCTQRDLLLE
jgi:hypothetical protein